MIVNSGSLEDSDKNCNYGKIAKAIGQLKGRNIAVESIDINTSEAMFIPEEKENKIFFGLSALSGINEEEIAVIKAGRPYKGIKDFMERCHLKKPAVINLIKSGAFDSCDEDFGHNRYKIMAYYLMNNCDMKKKLTVSNFNGLIQANLVSEDLELQVRIFNFNKYLKAKKVGKYYVFDDECIKFFNNFLSEHQSKLCVINGLVCILITDWETIYQSYMKIVKTWIAENHDELLNTFNQALFTEAWKKYAVGSLSAWEIQSVCMYLHEHELIDVNTIKYGISDFEKMPTTPEIDCYFRRGKSEIPIYKLSKIAGTVLSKNDSKSTITIQTTTGVVDVKFSREYYAQAKKQISEIQETGKKKVMEKSWFTRGTKLLINGFRREDTFVAKTYKSSNCHQLYKILEVSGEDIVITHERYQSATSQEEEEID